MNLEVLKQGIDDLNAKSRRFNTMSDQEKYDVIISIINDPHPSINRVKLNKYLSVLKGIGGIKSQSNDELELHSFKRSCRKFGRPKNIKTSNKMILDYWKLLPSGKITKRYHPELV